MSKALFLSILFSCQQNKQESNLSPEQSKLIARGKAVYMSECIACHNLNPKLPGSTGPDIWGSSFDLVKMRVLYAKYPEGYTPKRKTQLMVSFEELEPDLAAIHAFLNH